MTSQHDGEVLGACAADHREDGHVPDQEDVPRHQQLPQQQAAAPRRQQASFRFGITRC